MYEKPITRQVIGFHLSYKITLPIPCDVKRCICFQNSKTDIEHLILCQFNINSTILTSLCNLQHKYTKKQCNSSKLTIFVEILG